MKRSLRPRGKGWKRLGPFGQADPGVVHGEIWTKRAGAVRLRVISSLCMAELPDGSGETGLQHHVSISCANATRRPSAAHVQHLRWAFFRELPAEEDNHEPGNARHFWCPLDPARRVDCECKETEVTMVEPDGHVWSQERGAPCRACELAVLTNRPCRLHP